MYECNKDGGRGSLKPTTESAVEVFQEQSDEEMNSGLDYLDLLLLASKTCYQSIRYFSQSLGDYDREDWVETQDWERNSTIGSVKAVFSNPECLPVDVHEAWLVEMKSGGWVRGDVESYMKREHPGIVPYCDLSSDQKDKYRLLISVAVSVINMFGKKLDVPVTEKTNTSPFGDNPASQPNSAVTIVGYNQVCLGTYCKERGWSLASTESSDDMGYRVRYSDGSVSWCTKSQLKDMTAQIEGFTISNAVEIAKERKNISRRAWDEGMFVEYFRASNPKDSDLVKLDTLFITNTYSECIHFTPSIEDLVTADWYVVPEK